MFFVKPLGGILILTAVGALVLASAREVPKDAPSTPEPSVEHSFVPRSSVESGKVRIPQRESASPRKLANRKESSLIPAELSKRISTLDEQQQDRARTMCATVLQLVREKRARSEEAFQEELAQTETFLASLEAKAHSRKAERQQRSNDVHEAYLARMDEALKNAREELKSARDKTRSRLDKRREDFRTKLAEFLQSVEPLGGNGAKTSGGNGAETSSLIDDPAAAAGVTPEIDEATAAKFLMLAI